MKEDLLLLCGTLALLAGAIWLINCLSAIKGGWL